MFEKFVGELRSMSIADFPRRREVECLRSFGKQGQKFVFWNQEENTFTELNDFFVNSDLLSKKQFADGSRVYAKGWIHIMMIDSKNHYHLFPVESGFGFGNGLVYQDFALGKKNYDEELLGGAKKIETFSIIDHQNKVFYEAEKFVFEEDPFSFDLFNGNKRVILFKNQEELGMLYQGRFYPANTALARTKIHPLTKWWLSQH